ncbi:uncharacterized protein LOC143446888 [Clavelina lepadiformis]|uniref:uncharacterized protein LOC143446888 n=1 Tax=Clavelina lepadiformis TaxID=159417 RepID=UPI0040415B42
MRILKVLIKMSSVLHKLMLNLTTKEMLQVVLKSTKMLKVVRMKLSVPQDPTISSFTVVLTQTAIENKKTLKAVSNESPAYKKLICKQCQDFTFLQASHTWTTKHLVLCYLFSFGSCLL